MNNNQTQPRRSLVLLPSLVFFGLALACATAPKGTVSVDSSVEPSLRPGAVRKVAILPIRNVRLSPDELREINRAMVDGFQRQNAQISILGPAESVTRLNESNLAEVYSEFLRNYAQSAIPDVNALRRIGESLGVDAMLQGEVFDISTSDSVGELYGRTSLVIRYTLVANSTGTVLWQSTSRVVEYSKKRNQPAPTLFATMQKGQEKILGALPSLAQ